MPRDVEAPTRLLFVRHGESEANLRHVFSNRELPHGLSPRGRAQVESLAARLAGTPFAALYTSPILRARQSADILAERLGLTYRVTPALAEFDVGVLEGRSDAEGWRQYEALMDAWLVDGNVQARIDGGESLADVRQRFAGFIDALCACMSAGAAVLLVSHGGTLISVLPLLVANLDAGFARQRSLGYSEVIIVEMRGNGRGNGRGDGAGSLWCTQWGDIPLSRRG